MQRSFHVETNNKEDVVDITSEVVKIVKESGVDTGIVNLFVQGATASIVIQENAEGVVQSQSLSLLNLFFPGNRDDLSSEADDFTAHIKANILGQSKTLPITAGKIGISIWQSIFLYEFDGPRKRRAVVVTICRAS